MAERLGLDELRAHALDNIGTSRTSLGDERGFAQLEQAAEIALAVRSPEASRALNNLSSAHAQLGDFRRRGNCSWRPFGSQRSWVRSHLRGSNAPLSWET